jgi:hypothetical protein
VLGNKYKKDWLVREGIARGLISLPISERLPTLSDYCQAFGCSRGVVQNAVASLEASGAVTLVRRGKQGSYLKAKNDQLLLEMADLRYLTGSMPTPLNLHLAGLATGICQAMGRFSAPFTFAFIHGGRNRAEALARRVYDFVVVTRATAAECTANNPDIIEAFPLKGCKYSLPYKLYINAPNRTGLDAGMTIAADPASHDQYALTRALIANSGARLAEMSYIASRQAFLSGETDAIVFREDEAVALPFAGSIGAPAAKELNHDRISVVAIELPLAGEMELPVVLVNRNNYGMAGILKSYLGGELVSFIQNKVISQEMAPQFF